MAAALFGELRSEFLLLLLELVELHFDKFVMFQRVNQSGEELRAETFFAHLQRGLEPLSLGFEISDLRVGERIHVPKLRKSAPEATKNHHGARSQLPVKQRSITSSAACRRLERSGMESRLAGENSPRNALRCSSSRNRLQLASMPATLRREKSGLARRGVLSRQNRYMYPAGTQTTKPASRPQHNATKILSTEATRMVR